MNLTITTSDRSLASDLKRDAPFEVTIDSVSSEGTKDLGGLTLYDISLYIGELGSGITAGVAASWLYEKIKKRANKVSHKSVEIQIVEATLTRIIETEHCKISETITHKETSTRKGNC